MMRVEWTRSAIRDLAGIHAHIAQDSPCYAISVVDRLTNRTKQIAVFPFSGEMVPEYSVERIREVIEYSYRLIYLVENESIYVLAVIHGALPLPDSPPLNTG
ncbi:MAG: type II toxin-antitoxin system RelE/ParE family toxin [Pirellula sp.]|jgi:toxin ParE1/3/4